MLPVFEPVLTLYEPIAQVIVGLAAVAAAGMATVVWLVISADRRRPRGRATVTPIRSRLSAVA
jgi:hypothetical protein